MPTPQQVLDDPKFHQLPLGDRLGIMRRLDPNFASLDPKDQGMVIDQKASQFHPSPPTSDADTGLLDTLKKGGKRIGEAALGIHSGFERFLAHPIDTVAGIPQSLADATTARQALGPKAEQAKKEGHPMEAAGYYAASKMPFVGAPAAQAGEEIGRGEFGKGLADTAMLVAPFLVGGGKKTGEATAEAAPPAAGVKQPLPPAASAPLRTAKAAVRGAVRGIRETTPAKGTLKRTRTLVRAAKNAATGAAEGAESVGNVLWEPQTQGYMPTIRPDAPVEAAPAPQPSPAGRLDGPSFPEDWNPQIPDYLKPGAETAEQSAVRIQAQLAKEKEAAKLSKGGEPSGSDAARQYAKDHSLDYDSLDKNGKLTIEALVQSVEHPKTTAPGTPTPGGAPPSADPNYRINLGPEHTKQMAKLEAQQNLAKIMRESQPSNLGTARTNLREAEAEFNRPKPAGIPQPEAAPAQPVTPAVASSAERPTIKDENGAPLMYADNPASAPATSGVALPSKETAPTPAPTPAKVTSISDGKKAGRKTVEQTNADMADAIRGTKLEAFKKANPGATIADYMATQKGRQEIEGFLKSTTKPAKGLESPVKKSETAKPSTRKTTPAETPEDAAANSARKAMLDKLPEVYRNLKHPDKLGVEWRNHKYATEAAAADMETVKKLHEAGYSLDDWKKATPEQQAEMRKEAGAKSSSRATEKDLEGNLKKDRYVTALWEAATKDTKTAEAAVGKPGKPVKPAKTEIPSPVSFNMQELQQAQNKLGQSHAAEFYLQRAAKDGLKVEREQGGGTKLLRDGKRISMAEAHSWMTRAHADLIEYARTQPAVKAPLKKK